MIDMPIIKQDFYGIPDAFRSSGIPLMRCMVVGDTNTLSLFGETVSRAVSGVFREVYTYAFPSGEEHKNLTSIEGLIHELMDAHFDRKDCVLALGGGVVGDMAGFAAAIYLRGIRVVQAPTTLLAMIDSAIGGKTAVDFEGYKNMVGAFHMPVFVYESTGSLTTLPDDQFTAGMGEVVKSAVLGDADLYWWLRKYAQEITGRKEEALYEMILRTSRIKVDIVNEDPKETKGKRALLNLGHTIGHAIEKYKQFSMLHGDCVAVGLIAAANMSARRGLLTKEDVSTLKETCSLFGLPLSVTDIDPEEVLRITKSDKKMSAGHIRFVLIRRIGEAFLADDVTDAELLEGIQSVMD